jgi:DNA-binding ferritin-like protein
MELKILLSYLRALSEIYQHAHWESSGTNYFGDHLLYERLYNETSGEIDGVAEKTIGISGDSKIINPIEDSKITSQIVTKFTKGEFNPESFPEIAIAAEKELIKIIANLMAAKPSDGVQNMLQGISDKHEGHLYLLQQRNKGAAVIISD